MRAGALARVSLPCSPAAACGSETGGAPGLRVLTGTSVCVLCTCALVAAAGTFTHGHGDLCICVPGTARGRAVNAAFVQPQDGRPVRSAPHTHPSLCPLQALGPPLKALLGRSVPGGDVSLPHAWPSGRVPRLPRAVASVLCLLFRCPISSQLCPPSDEAADRGGLGLRLSRGRDWPCSPVTWGEAGPSLGLHPPALGPPLPGPCPVRLGSLGPFWGPVPAPTHAVLGLSDWVEGAGWGPPRLSVGGVLGGHSDTTCGQVDERAQK